MEYCGGCMKSSFFKKKVRKIKSQKRKEISVILHDDAKNGFTVNLAIYSKQKRGVQVFVSDNGVL